MAILSDFDIFAQIPTTLACLKVNVMPPKVLDIAYILCCETTHSGAQPEASLQSTVNIEVFGFCRVSRGSKKITNPQNHLTSRFAVT